MSLLKNIALNWLEALVFLRPDLGFVLAVGETNAHELILVLSSWIVSYHNKFSLVLMFVHWAVDNRIVASTNTCQGIG